MKLTKISNIIVFVLFATMLALFSYKGTQSSFVFNLSLYSGMFFCYLIMLYNRKQWKFNHLTYVALILHLVVLISETPLSPDVFRFIWDGELITQGIHPYAHLPVDLIENPDFNFSPYLQEIYSQMTDLSKNNYSIYPTVNQVYFFITAFFTENKFAAIVIMRILILLTHITGFIYLLKLLEFLKIDKYTIFILALNPFVIIEFAGNLHFEAVMFSWLVIGIYFLLKNKWLLGAFFWSIAINVKLTPLLLLPFLFRYLGIKKSIQFYVATGVFTTLMLLVFLWPSMIANFMQSINLYFNNFEFNASIYFLLKALFYPIYGWETIYIFGPLLSKIALVLIVLLAFSIKKNNLPDLFLKMFLGYVVYLLFSTTVHPWYIMLPLGLSIFTRTSFMIIWSYTIMFTYGFYLLGESWIISLLISIEYFILALTIIYELVKKKRIIQF